VTAAGEYSVRLEDVNFEGPLDLLLFLIKKNEIEITDIPIALVTGQFLAYLERITAANLEGAGDFLLMAATLMRIKSQMLLPPPEGEEEEIEDPRRELVERLLEYQQFKEIAQDLREREARARSLYPRGERTAEELAGPPEGSRAPGAERRVSLKDLLRAFASVLAARKDEPVHHVETVRVTLEEKVHEIRAALAERGRVRFGELFSPEAPRIELVVTLIALLEMVRNREVRLSQPASFGEIEIVPAPPEPARADPDEPEAEAGEAAQRAGGSGEGEGPWTPV
jgi:segregation and condensation protein A